MSDLITSARALNNLDNRATTSDEDATLAALITAVSRAIENYCWRTFSVTSYDELYPGNDRRELVLRNYPLISVERVAHGPMPVLRATNTSSSNQRATVKVTPVGLELIHVASGVSATDDILFSDQPTLTALASAITALGNGWTGTVLDPANDLRASADLRALQGAFFAMNVNADLKMHLSELSAFQVDMERGLLTWDGGAGWFGGVDSWRVLYSAGFSDIPDEVQEACAGWVAQLFWQTKRDPGLASESIPGTLSRVPLRDMPTSTKLLLGPYRNWRV
jgi:hypothetical protein